MDAYEFLSLCWCAGMEAAEACYELCMRGVVIHITEIERHFIMQDYILQVTTG